MFQEIVSPERRLQIEPDFMKPAWLVSARSYLLDRFTPACEEIRLPGRRFGGGEITFRTGVMAASPPTSGRRLDGLRRRLSAARRVDEGVFIDLRWGNPENWAHFLVNHLPIVFAITAEASLDPDRLRLVLPGRAPRYVLEVARLFGFETLTTNGLVTGCGVAYDVKPSIGINSDRVGWVRNARVRRALDGAADGAGRRPLPRRVFLSRRDTRRLINEAEIAAFLAERGFEKIYPEDLSVADQFRLFEQAEAVVAVHGAGVAPLLYRSAEAAPARIMELFPCTHMTPVWRAVAGQVGCSWVGVRGRLRPEHVTGAYDLGTPFLRYSLQDFEVDPASIERAFEIMEAEHGGA